MNTLDDKTRLEHMLESARDAVMFLGDKNVQDLLKDRMALQAIVRSVEIIGEAAAQISRPYRDSHPEIPWTQIIGMRNRLIHAYFDIDLDVVWDTVTIAMPKLIEQIDGMLRAEEEASDSE